MPLNSREIREKYNSFAPKYDLLEGIPDLLLGVWRLRRELVQRASGRILEVAVGTGKNLRYYPSGCRVTAVDLSHKMLSIARRRALKLDLDIALAVMDAEALAFPAHSFDTIVSSLTTCTFPNPAAALREMARVCRTDGRILLLEHGRSNHKWIGRWQDRHTERHAEFLGCHWNREPLDLVREAGLTAIASGRTFFGIFHVIEATPLQSLPRTR